jgi:hypothetical protein
VLICRQIYIKDVKSSNGTFINGERLSSEGHESEPFELKSDDIVVCPFYCGILAPNSPCLRNSVSISSVKTTKPSSTTRSLPAWCASLPSRMSKSQPVRNSITSSSNTSSNNNSNNITNSSSSSITNSNNSSSSNNNNRPNNIPLDSTPRSTASTSAGRSSRSVHSVVPNSFLPLKDPWDSVAWEAWVGWAAPQGKRV